MKELLERTFENEFNEPNYKDLVNNLFNGFDFSQEHSLKEEFNEAEKSHLKDFAYLGTFKDTENMHLDVLKVELKGDSKVERARSLQRNLIGKHLGKYNKDAALVAFFSKARPDWRLSFVKMDYKLSDKGIKLELTPPKRYSFLVGKNEPSHTAKKQLQSVISPDVTPTVLDVEKAFSIEKVTKEFYSELQNWYFWAMDRVRFPKDFRYSDDPTKDDELRNAINLIRLITRIIFIWFIRQKNLIPETLFDIHFLRGAVKDFYKNDEAFNYYQAILQNLFFGTLNQKVDERDFIKEGDFKINRQTYGIKNFYRYSDKFLISKKEAASLFKDIPFLNGGLFDCLDKPNENGKIVYIDGYSRNPSKQAIIPDYLFFRKDETAVDLSLFGLGRNQKVKGLFEILKTYNFTVDENIPVDQEIALDPELLGMVFENLLASYNPETATTARKATGSYYTPREIVDYMTDEALIARLRTVLDNFAEKDDNEGRLRHLLSYIDELHKLSKKETPKIIAAIHNINIIDPACGSGAFPMGILHKLVHILHKLDPDNKQWEELQIQKAVAETEEAYRIGNKEERERRLLEINSVFDQHVNEPDYARKLYLIENCIYGVDIQPIAVQIAKLRFFISLVIDQKTDESKPNRGIIPLPNLETKFVAANALIGLDKPEQLQLKNLEIEEKEKELKRLRHRYFEAKTRREKLSCQQKDRQLRKQLASLLQHDGWDKATAENIVEFDPYDQNTFASWFDPEWMFGVKGGFDITIGNPPYVRADAGEEHLSLRKRIIESGQYETLWEKWDLFIPFIELGYKLLKENGVTTMIVSDAYCHSKYAQKSQNWFLKNSRILRLDFLSKIKVFEAGVHNIVYFFQKAEGDDYKPERLEHEDEFGGIKVLPTDTQRNLTYRAFFPEDETRNNSFTCKAVQLATICYISKGMVVHADEKVAQGAFELKDVLSTKKDGLHPKPFIEGKDVDKWLPTSHKWLEWGTKRAPALFSRPTFIELYEQKEKLFLVKVGAVRVAFDDQRFYCNEGIYVALPWSYLSGVRNKSLKKFARYRGERPVRHDLPKREELETTSKRFEIKYLLAVLNSTPARDFLRTNRRNNVQLYPGDWKQLPIPDVPFAKQAPIIELVDQILITKKKNPQADVSILEKKIDKLVYALYGLTPEEIEIVEGKN